MLKIQIMFHGFRSAQKRAQRVFRASVNIFGEPNSLTHPEHAMRAFDGMIRLFAGVDLKLTDTSDSCFALDMNLPPGISPEQQISLAERNGDCDKPTGGRTGNCFMIMVDARKPA